jgi:hypothetical protein
MTGRRTSARLAIGLLWASLGAVVLSCHSDVRFDDQSIDAGTAAPINVEPGDAAVADAAADVLACQGVRCGYETDSCNTNSCEMECPQGRQCTGLCGAGCTTDCEEDSQCTLLTGNGARIRCEQRARCLLTLGVSSEGRCEGGSRCDIVCLGACALLCDSGATCSFACTPNAPLAAFTGHASCP